MKKYLLIGGAALLAIVLVVIARRRNAPQNTIEVEPAPELPSYTPSSARYVPSSPTQPVIVGAIPADSTSASSAPPGVNLAAVALAPQATPAHVVYDLPPGAEPAQVPAAIAQTGTVNAPPAAYSGNAALVDQEYQVLFNRHAEAAGLAYWTHALDNGLSAADLARDLTRGAQGSDIATEQQKVPLISSSYRGG